MDSDGIFKVLAKTKTANKSQPVISLANFRIKKSLATSENQVLTFFIQVRLIVFER